MRSAQAVQVNGFGVLVSEINVVVNGLYEFSHAVNGQASDLPCGDLAEEPFDEIQSRGGGGEEVEVDATLAFQPVLHLGVLVGGVVVQDEVEFQVGVGLFLDSLD